MDGRVQKDGIVESYGRIYAEKHMELKQKVKHASENATRISVPPVRETKGKGILDIDGLCPL